MTDKKVDIDLELNILKGSNFGEDIIKSSTGSSKGAFEGLGEKDYEKGAEDPESTLSLSQKILQVAKIATPEMLFMTIMAIPIVFSQFALMAVQLVKFIGEKLGISQILDWFSDKKDWILGFFNRGKKEEDELNNEQAMMESWGGDTFFWTEDEEVEGEKIGEIEYDEGIGSGRSLEEIEKLQEFLNRLIELHEQGKFEEALQEILDNDILTGEEKSILVEQLDTNDFLNTVNNMQDSLNQQKLSMEIEPHINGERTQNEMESVLNGLEKQNEEANARQKTSQDNALGDEERFMGSLGGLYNTFREIVEPIASLIAFIRDPSQLHPQDPSRVKADVDGIINAAKTVSNQLDLFNAAIPNHPINFVANMGNQQQSFATQTSGIPSGPVSNWDQFAPTGYPRTNSIIQDDS
jgi:hypothetical protein